MYAIAVTISVLIFKKFHYENRPRVIAIESKINLRTCIVYYVPLVLYKT